MASRREIEEFLAERTLALAGASRAGGGFGNSMRRELLAKGYRILVVHPEAERIGGDPAWPSFDRLPEVPGGALVVTPSARTPEVVQSALAAGIRRFWLQQGAGSPEAVRLAREAGALVVDGECVLMFAEPAGFVHRLHRGLWKLLGRIPD